MKITRVRCMADLPDVLAENVRSWPHYPANSDTHPDDAYTDGLGTWDPLVSENGERGEWRLTGYAEAGTTTDGYRLWLLRMNDSTFTYGYMLPGDTRLTVGSVRDPETGAKATVEEWIAEQHALDLTPAVEAGIRAYNAGRPVKWWEYAGYEGNKATDPGMVALVDGDPRVYGLARYRLGRAFTTTWEAQAANDRALAEARVGA